MEQKKRRYRFGDRSYGRRIRSLASYYQITPFIMKTRGDASNFFTDSIEVTEIDKYLRGKRAQGYKGMGMLHVFLAAYVRTVSQRPGLNRFISGQRIYARNGIEMTMTVKHSLSSSAAESSIMLNCDPSATILDIYSDINTEVTKIKAMEENDTDKTAKLLTHLPALLLKAFVALMNTLDYFGIMPKAILKASPFHGSLFISDLGSLGIPPIYHHLYNFGNLPIFITFGAKRKVNEIADDGSVVTKKYIDYTAVLDERICDGFYYAQSFKIMKDYMRHPEKLEVPPEEIVEDVD